MVLARSISSRALVADIGGTNARFGIADLEKMEISQFQRYPCSAFSSLSSAAKAYLDSVTDKPVVAAIAVAGPVFGEEITLTNSRWSFTRQGLRALLGVDTLVVINDFEAQAYSLPFLKASDLHQIGSGTPAPHATKVVLGPGTGLGLAGLAWSGTNWLAISGEGGHSSFAVQDARELAILERLREGKDHLSVERVLSGPGLANLYGVLTKIQGCTVEGLHAPDVVQRALARQDAIAEEALQRFVAWLARFAGDMALVFGARGGVYLGGGIAPNILKALNSGPFRRTFETKGRLQSFLAAVPVYVILTGHAGLIGAAAALSMYIPRSSSRSAR